MTDPFPHQRQTDVAGDTNRFARLRFGRLIWWPLVIALAFVVVALSTPLYRTTGLTIGAWLFYAALMLAALQSCREAGIQPSDIVGGVPHDRQSWRTAVLLAPLLLIFSAMCAWLTIIVAGRVAPGWAAQQLEERQSASLLDGFGPIEAVFLGLVIAFIGPFVEEFVFRGMLLRKWQATRGLRFGIIANAALFAVLHPHMSIGAFVFGIVLSLLYLGTGSLLPAVLVHVINNSVVALAGLGGRSTPDKDAALQSLADVQSEWAIPVLLALLSGAAILFLTFPLARQANR